MSESQALRDIAAMSGVGSGDEEESGAAVAPSDAALSAALQRARAAAVAAAKNPVTGAPGAELMPPPVRSEMTGLAAATEGMVVADIAVADNSAKAKAGGAGLLADTADAGAAGDGDKSDDEPGAPTPLAKVTGVIVTVRVRSGGRGVRSFPPF